MHYRPQASRRERGAITVEAAIVLPTALFFMFAIIVGATGVFTYQEVAHVARETARYASVHGGQYANNNATAITAGTLPRVNDAYLTSYAQGISSCLNTSQLTVSVQMAVLTPGATDASTTEVVDWDDVTDNQHRSPYSAWTNSATTPASNVQMENMVSVTVSYNWSPGMGLLPIGTITLTSTAVMPMSY